MNRVFKLAAILSTVLFCNPTVAFAGAVGAAYDALTTPNVKVRLSAKFEKNWGRFIRPDIRGETVQFSLAGKSVGSSKTDSDGLASIAVVCSSLGEFPWSATLKKASVTVTGKLRVIAPTKGVFVFDIDSTLSDMSEVFVPFRGRKASCFEYSPTFVGRLAKRYEIVYLTARDDTFLADTMAFLKRHSFPKGTVIHNEISRDGKNGNQLWPSNHGKFKAAVIAELKQRKVNVIAGVGNAETDSQAYKACKIPGFIRGSTYKGSVRFDSYRQLEKIFIKRGWLSAPKKKPTKKKPTKKNKFFSQN